MKKQGYEYRFLGSKKHKVLAMLLCITGGFLGLHYFYVGRKVRGSINLILAIMLAIASGYFIRNRIWVSFYCETGSEIVVWLKVHWREVMAIVSFVPLAIMWVIDFVKIAKGEFRDNEGMKLI